jgi:hypothetical protein
VALLFHYTDREGYNAIRSQPVWLFRASRPPGDHPIGAYFTLIAPDRRKAVCKKLSIPREKTEYCFAFVDVGDLSSTFAVFEDRFLIGGGQFGL